MENFFLLTVNQSLSTLHHEEKRKWDITDKNLEIRTLDGCLLKRNNHRMACGQLDESDIQW